MAPLLYTHIPSPLGPLLLAGDDAALHFLSFPSGHKSFGPRPGWQPSAATFAEVRRQLDAYFAGDLRAFDLPLHIAGTALQTALWRYLPSLPFGTVQTYGTAARATGHPRASRAIGAANGANPIPIILPCHRLVGSTGALTGFGGGLPAKVFLLRHEGVLGAGEERVAPSRLGG